MLQAIRCHEKFFLWGLFQNLLRSFKDISIKGKERKHFLFAPGDWQLLLLNRWFHCFLNVFVILGQLPMALFPSQLKTCLHEIWQIKHSPGIYSFLIILVASIKTVKDFLIAINKKFHHASFLIPRRLLSTGEIIWKDKYSDCLRLVSKAVKMIHRKHLQAAEIAYNLSVIFGTVYCR